MRKKRLHEAGQARPTFAQWVFLYALKLMRLLTLIIHVLTKAAAGDTEWRIISWNRENWMPRRAWRMEYLSIFFLISLAYFPKGQQYKILTPELFLKCACKFRATFPQWAPLCPWALTLLSAQICLLIEDVLESDRAWCNTGKNSILNFVLEKNKPKKVVKTPVEVRDFPLGFWFHLLTKMLWQDGI